MISKAITAWLISTVTVALAFLVAGVPRAQGQIYVQACCQGTFPINMWCTMPGCSGKIVTYGCDVYGYGSGYWYNSETVYCCTAQASTFVNTDRMCWIGGEGIQGELERAQLTERVWVRDCRGRYALLTVPVRAYPA